MDRGGFTLQRKAVHYLCDESSDWFPDLDDIALKLRLVRVGSLLSTQITQRRGIFQRAFNGDCGDCTSA